MDLFKLLDVSSPKIIRDTLNRTITAFNILEEYATETANNALRNSEAARTAAEQALQNANSAVDTANNAEEQSRSAVETATNALDTANTASADALTALEVSNRALLDSAQAVATSNTASANASNALEKATAAVNVSDTANVNASTALSNSTQAMDTANTAHQKAEEAIATADEAKTEAASAKSVADTAEANSISAVNTATTAASTSNAANTTAADAKQIAQNALDLITEGVGSQVLVNGVAVDTFNADTKADVTYVDQKVADLVGSAPDTLDTLEELSGALKNNKDIVKVLEDAIATKANASDIMTILATKANKTDLDNYLHINSPVLTKDNSGNSGYIRLKDAKENTNSFTISTAANGGVGVLSTYSIGELGYIMMSSHNSTRDISYNFDDSLTASGCTTEGTSFKLNLGTDESPWGNIHGTTIYQNGKQVANAEDIPTDYVKVQAENEITAPTIFKSTTAAPIALYRTRANAGVFIDYYNNNQTTNYTRVGIFSNDNWGVCVNGAQGSSLSINRNRQLVKDLTYTYTFPNKTGTLATLDDIPTDYLPLSAGEDHPITGLLALNEGLKTNELIIKDLGTVSLDEEESFDDISVLNNLTTQGLYTLRVHSGSGFASTTRSYIVYIAPTGFGTMLRQYLHGYSYFGEGVFQYAVRPQTITDTGAVVWSSWEWKTMASESDIPKLGTSNWNVSQDSSGSLVFTYA